jgi:hypothetical protein
VELLGRVLVLGLEERPGLIGVGEPAANEDLGEHVADAELALELQCRREVIAWDLEAGSCGRGRRAIEDPEGWAGDGPAVWIWARLG